MSWLYNKAKKLAQVKWIIVFLVLFIISYNLINGQLIGVKKLTEITGGTSILDLQPYYTPQQAYEILQQQGEAGRLFYRDLLIYQDFIFPLIYTFFWLSLLTFLSSKWLKSIKLLHLVTLIPIIGGVSDYTENILILKMLSAYPQKLLNVAYICNIFNIIKYMSMIITMLIIFISIIVLTIQRFQSKIS